VQTIDAKYKYRIGTGGYASTQPLLLAGTFAFVHICYWYAGVRFDRSTLIEVMHFVDPALLRERMAESLWYLHIQPPLYNLFVGLVLKVTPESPYLFQTIHLALGFSLYACTYALQRRMGVRRGLAYGCSTFFLASPSFILWEHLLLYTLPCAALIAGASLLLLRALEGKDRAAWHGFFWLVLTLCGIRTMFHLGYLVVVYAGAAIPRVSRKRVLNAGAIPLLLLVAMYAKTYVLFGQFNVCTFSPKNLWIMTVGNMNGEKKVQWVKEGKLSPLSLINRWESVEAYPPEYHRVPERFSKIPVLANVHKSTGAVNYNHYGLIAAAQLYGRDAKYALLHDPWSYAVAVSQSMYRYFIASHALPVSPHNQAHMGWMLWIYDELVYGKLPHSWVGSWRIVQLGQYPPYFVLIIALPLVFFYGVARALGWGPALSHAQRGTLAFMCFTILCVFALGCALDFLETARYRFMTDGLSLVLLGMALQQYEHWLERINKRIREANEAACAE
jgi:hypothetical protein